MPHPAHTVLRTGPLTNQELYDRYRAKAKAEHCNFEFYCKHGMLSSARISLEWAWEAYANAIAFASKPDVTEVS